MQTKSCVMTREFTEKTGLSTKEIQVGTLVEYEKDTETINFYPAKNFGVNFSKYVTEPQMRMQKEEVTKTVKEYTNHVTWYCSQVNLLLAADSPEITKHSDYIRRLNWSILYLANLFPVKDVRCYRGMTCSKKEIDHYQLGNTLYIPSFLSTSRNINKLYTSDKQNTVMVINLSKIPNSAFTVNAEHSEFAETEEEALFSCYSKFKVSALEQNKMFNNRVYEYYIELDLKEDFEGLTKNQNYFCLVRELVI